MAAPRQTRRLASRRRGSRAGDDAAFAELYDRHHASLLVVLPAHARQPPRTARTRSSRRSCARTARCASGRLPDAVRPWLFAIARNRCLHDAGGAARRRRAGRGRRAVLRRPRRRRRRAAPTCASWSPTSARLPEDQRGALVLFELGGLSPGRRSRRRSACPPAKVKALVFQARTELMAERDARATPCDDDPRGSSRSRAAARCGADRCAATCASASRATPTALAVARQRAGLASILPVAPALGLKAAILAAAAGERPTAGAARGAGGRRRLGGGAGARRRRSAGQAGGAAAHGARRLAAPPATASGASGAAAAAHWRRRRGEWRRSRRRRGGRAAARPPAARPAAAPAAGGAVAAARRRGGASGAAAHGRGGAASGRRRSPRWRPRLAVAGGAASAATHGGRRGRGRSRRRSPSA